NRLCSSTAMGLAQSPPIGNAQSPDASRDPTASATAGRPRKKTPMLAWLKSGRERRQVARSLYGSEVTAAPAATFSADEGVPDAQGGRFEAPALHVGLLVKRLAAVSPPDRRLSVALTEAFVVDMDDSMRELTFGDLAVPREIKRATAALFDRHAAYLAALAGGFPHSPCGGLQGHVSPRA